MNGFFKELQEDPTALDRALYPGRQLADFDPNSLTIEVLPSGFESFDKNFVLKKNRGELILIGARPSHGKSALLFQMAYNVAQYGKSHVFSLEMDHDSVATRQIAAVINRPIDAVQRGLHPDTIMKAQLELRKLNMHVDDRSGITVEEICYSARQENKRGRVDAVFIDYIQIIPTPEGHSRAVELAKVSLQLKALAKELKIPVIVASQLNRNSDSREDKTPQLSDLKESGALEQDADVVILLHRDQRNAAAEAKVIIAKNRNGPTSEILMEYAPAQCRFIDSDGGI